MPYPGGKGLLYQKIINLIPPHRVYIETHLGGGTIARMKRPAARNILIDIDPDVIEQAAAIAGNGDTAGHWEIVQGDAVEWLKGYHFNGDEFIYSDPPYLLSTRKQQRPIYRYEYATEAQHIELLTCLKELPCRVMISGYWSQLYADMLAGWHTECFETTTRGNSKAIEWLWMNYPTPLELHDYTHLGETFRERERIKRKKQRWINKLSTMPLLERRAIMAAIDTLRRDKAK